MAAPSIHQDVIGRATATITKPDVPTAKSTSWHLVVALILAGVVGALPLGRTAIAVPLLRQNLGISITSAALVVSAYAVLAALTALPAGSAVTRFGPRRAIIIGLLLIGLGSGLGALASSAPALIATRVVESCGFLGVIIGVPVLLRTLTAPQDRDLALALWGTYLPAGSAIMMLGGPFIAAFGWQTLWLVTAVVAVLYAAIVWLAVPTVAEPAAPETAVLRNAVKQVLSSPAPLTGACVFALYAFQYFSISGLLPLLLVERLGASVAQAGFAGAAVVVANAIGNSFAGVALRIGVPLWAIIAAAFAFLGAASFGIFSEALPFAAVALLASANLAISGLIPASIFAASPRLAPSASLLGVTLGLITQASNIGQLLGPVVLGFWAQAFGWSAAPALFVALAAIGIFLALRLRHQLSSNGSPT